MGCEQAQSLITNPNPAVGALNQLIYGFTDPVVAEIC
jgi:hypothetical protein